MMFSIFVDKYILNYKFILALLLVSCSFVLPLIQLPINKLAYLRLDDIIWFVFFIITCPIIIKKFRVIILTRENARILLYFTIFILLLQSIILQNNIVNNINYGLPVWMLFRYFEAIYVFVSVQYMLKRYNNRYIFLYIIILAGFVLSIVGILQHFNVLSVYKYHSTYILHKSSYITSLLSYNNNHLGTFLMVASLLIIDRIVAMKKKAYIIIHLLICAMILYCLLLSNSRASYLGFITGIFVYLILHMSTFKVYKILFLIFILIVMQYLLFNFSDIFYTWLYEPNRYGSALIRLESYGAIYKIILANPLILLFGVGFGNFNYILSPKIGFGSAHNLIIHVLCEIGIFGLSLYLLFWLNSFKMTLSCANQKIKTNKILQSIIIALFTSGLSGETLYPLLSTENNFLMIMSFMGIMMSEYV